MSKTIFRNIILALLIFFAGLNIRAQNRKSMFFNNTASGFNYANASYIFSLRKFYNWSLAVIVVRRSSDDAQALVFFDGAISYDTITLNSYISTANTTTIETAVPDTSPNVTLSTWLGSDDCFIVEWHHQKPTAPMDRLAALKQATKISQPKLATAGVLETENGTLAPLYDGTNDWMFSSTTYTELDNTNNFTITIVSNHTTNNTQSIIFNTNTNATDAFVIKNDRRTNKQIIKIEKSPSPVVLYSSQQNISNQKLLTAIHNSTNIIGYYNGTLQNTTAHSGVAYINQKITLGDFKSAGLPVKGSVQEFIIFNNELSTDNLALLHADINTYYSIY